MHQHMDLLNYRSNNRKMVVNNWYFDLWLIKRCLGYQLLHFGLPMTSVCHLLCITRKKKRLMKKKITDTFTSNSWKIVVISSVWNTLSILPINFVALFLAHWDTETWSAVCWSWRLSSSLISCLCCEVNEHLLAT